MSIEDELAGISFNDDRERRLFIEARFGETVRTFCNTELGRYLRDRAYQDCLRCREELVELDASSPDFKQEFLRLQNKHYAAENFIGWLGDAMTVGGAATVELEGDLE